MLRLISLLAALCALGTALVAAPPAPATETEIVCGDEEQPMPALDEDGFIAEPDASTPEERAGDYDDSAEDQQIPEDEGDELTPEERAAMDRCLAGAVERTLPRVMRSLRRGSRKLTTIGPEELPYGGRVDCTVRTRSGRLLARARLALRSGETKTLRLRGRARGRVVVRLKLTDGMSGRSDARGARARLRR